MNVLKIFFFIFALVFTFFNYSAKAEVVKKVEIVGNERITNETVKVYGDIVIGKNYNAEDVNNLIKSLYSTGFFSEISAKLDKGVLSLTVKEHPLVNSLVLNGIKAEKFIAEIKKIMDLKYRTSFKENLIPSDIYKIKNFYRELGFYFVEIDVEVRDLTNNRVDLIFNVKEGEKAKIAKIFFVGDKKIRDKKLREVITSEEDKAWKFLSRNKYLNSRRVALDERLIKNYLKNKGYYEAKVSSSNVEHSKGEGFILTFNVEAGKRYRFRKAQIKIEDSLNKSSFTKLGGDLKKVVGEYYSPKKLSKILKQIDILSQQKDLQFINYKINEQLNDNFVDLRIDIFEGKKIFVERVDIIGNTVTNEDVIRSEMIVDEGEPFSPLLVNKSINNLKSRNLFASVDKRVLPGTSKDLKVLEIKIEEKPTGEIAAGAGIGSRGGSFAASVNENNFLGTGVRLNTSLELTEESVRGMFAVNNPNFRYSGNALNTSIQSKKIDRLSEAGYETTKTGFTLGTGFEQYENVFIAPNFTLFYEDVETSAKASAAYKKLAGSFTTASLDYYLTLDKRNQKFQTTEGFRTSFYQKLPIYADAPSLTNGLDFVKYQPIFTEDIIGSIRLYSRSIHAIGNEDVKVTDRLNLPSKFLRGFKRGRIGPKDADDHIGGNYAAALGFNASLPNLLPEALKTDISIFLDNGSVWDVDYDGSLPVSDTLRSSLGVSANTFTPIGPLSFTYARALNKDSTDETETFEFNIGTTF